MREISGFGGGYEAVCRSMVLAGVEWLSKNSTAAPLVSYYRNITGLHNNENVDAEKLEAAMLDAPVFLNGKQIQKRAGDDCTGAMAQYSISHALRIKAIGWEPYCDESRKMRQEASHA